MLKAQQMQEAVENAKASLADISVSGSAGNGLVSVIVTGDGELTSVTFGVDAAEKLADDLETLGDLVVAAVRDATRKASQQEEQLMAQATGNFDIESLGLDALGLGDLGLGGPPTPATPTELPAGQPPADHDGPPEPGSGA
ncbi:MAG: YbaB/EbfC family nucleoid-associated protein [Actinomycetota bacterium]|nr:YbaB/EbfC family nucleoid-associated protein [Actinomycetota bacterium]